jgi:RNA polymerase sigma-70 factor (ECF subfamily)
MAKSGLLNSKNGKGKPKPSTNNKMTHIATFQKFRPLLFAIAYRMMGTVTEAEDILQDAYLRWQGQPLDAIRDRKYYLTTIVTRLCLNQLSSAKNQRETYLGPWLPEPLFTENRPELMNPAEQVATYDSISIAFLVLLEALSPAERAAFLLHEVFAYRFAEVADILNKSEAACRQLFHRARQHIAANQPRFDTSTSQHKRLLHRFIETVETGEIEAFLQMLTDDVMLVPDGGGQQGAAIHVVKGHNNVSAFILGSQRLAPAGILYEVVMLNGQWAIVALTLEKRPYFALFLYVRNDLIQLMHVIAGTKLKGMQIKPRP